MSVVKSKRSTSKAEFLRVSRDLEVYLIKTSQKASKNSRFFFNNYLIDPAAKIQLNLKYANSIYPQKKEDYMERIKFFNRSFRILQSLISQVEIAQECYSQNIWSLHDLKEISEMMCQLQALIKGVIDSDKKNLKDIS